MDTVVITDQPGQKPSANLYSIELTYTHRHDWASTGDSPQVWCVSADGHPEGDDEPVSHVADIEIILLDPDETRDALGVLDGHDGDVGLIAETILDPASGLLKPELADRLESFSSRILILNHVRLASEWRGLGIGVLLAGLAIKRLSGGCQAAVCYPSPLADPDSQICNDNTVERDAAFATLSQVWSQLGFEHFRNGVYVLDLALLTLNEALEQLRERLLRYA